VVAVAPNFVPGNPTDARGRLSSVEQELSHRWSWVPSQLLFAMLGSGREARPMVASRCHDQARRRTSREMTHGNRHWACGVRELDGRD